MQITTRDTLLSLRPDDLSGRTAAVIDVLRATSTIVTALAHGAREVVPCLTPEEALARAQGAGAWLCGGERGAVPLPGFDCGNSPREYTESRVAGRSVALTTTNGTRALRACQSAGGLIAASLLNAPACARFLAAAGRDVVLVCAGTEDQYDLCDATCAGALAEALLALGAVAGDDQTLACLELYRRQRHSLAEWFAASRHGRHLLALGAEADIAYCAQVGLFHLVAHWQDGALRAVEAPPD